ncbi:MAG: glycerophosphodiester phosphodiesterase, partial [Lachnospiraceae bacterium]|nr:glycerophosphodiester phosphodiesterase [Lachnospiraceae bacterium]
MKPVIIAHRGASALARHENSLEAFQIAIDLGSDYVEFD